MVQKPLIHTDTAAAATASQTKAQTDRLFVEKSRIVRQIRRVEADIEAGGSDDGNA